MRKKLILFMIVTLLTIVSPVFAIKTIRIEPHALDPPNPIMLESPATFNISVTEHTAYNPQILLVMTEACKLGLTGNVLVEWNGASTSFSAAAFVKADTSFIPPSTTGADYQVSSLKDHIGVPHSEDIYYAYGSFLSGPITETNQTFTVSLTSTATRMLVYAIGKTDQSGEFDNSVPNTRPGFVVPEPGSLILALASFSAFVLYAVKRKKA